MAALSGRWKLVYTSSPPTLLLLGALDALPLLAVTDVSQEVDAVTMTATNRVCASLHGMRTGLPGVCACLHGGMSGMQRV